MSRTGIIVGTHGGLERSCELPKRDRIVAAPAMPGIERIEASFLGKAFEPHRHDTYAIGVTLQGVQTFRYRGVQRFSTPGHVIALHPDEIHDGGAGTDAGLRYRMLYLEPWLVRRGLGSEQRSLPFIQDPVVADDELRSVLLGALEPLEDELDELLVDDLVLGIAQGLTRRAGQAIRPLGPIAVGAAAKARACLCAAIRPVGSADLETITGLDRFELCRHFRSLYGTSPHRFGLMRRLERARAMIGGGERLAEVAASTGFADQSHLTRHFKNAFGMPPGRWASLVGARARG